VVGESSIQEAGMGGSKKGHKAAKAEKGKQVKPRNLAKKDLDARQAETVRGGFRDFLITKKIDKSSPVL
jgi:hypothetical protein